MALAVGAVAQQNTSASNGCMSGYYPGSDTVVLTIPYTYAQSMSIIGSFKNLTWSGNPDDTVTLNGTDNTVGTSRSYDNSGAHIVETLTTYSKPAAGPYLEIHKLGLTSIAAVNLSAYADFDGTTVVPTCNGRASIFNLTINFCANNISVAASVFHTVHLTDIQTVGVFLGGQNFSSCDRLSNGTANGTATGNATGTATMSGAGKPTITASDAVKRVGPVATVILLGFGVLVWVF